MIYLILFFSFFIIGLFTFGGGYAMIPLIEDLVISKEWMTIDEFYSFLGVCESTPGPIAINMATFIGTSQGGLLGAIAATLGGVLPSFIIILLVASLLKKFIDNKYVKTFLNGIKPVVIALILSTGLILLAKSIGYTNLESFTFNTASFIIFAFIAILYNVSKYVFKIKLNTILLIIISALSGIIIYII